MFMTFAESVSVLGFGTVAFVFYPTVKLSANTPTYQFCKYPKVITHSLMSLLSKPLKNLFSLPE